MCIRDRSNSISNQKKMLEDFARRNGLPNPTHFTDDGEMCIRDSFIAAQLREIMARLGARTVEQLVGRADLLKAKEGAPIDLSALLGFSRNTCCRPGCAYDLHLKDRADKRGRRALTTADRAFGTTLPGDADIEVYGCGGQAFGAFVRQGQKITLHGEANDYLGKGLSGGTLAVCPPEGAHWNDGDALIGNVALYGATSGEAYIAGAAGERFCVRNSGAVAVAEGVGDHGCEYMTGGRAVILGPVGDNFAAGMSGGIAYVLDKEDALARRIHAGALEVGPVTGVQAEELQAIIKSHARRTGSPIATSILSRWAEALPAFKMVIPTEYRRCV